MAFPRIQGLSTCLFPHSYSYGMATSITVLIMKPLFRIDITAATEFSRPITQDSTITIPMKHFVYCGQLLPQMS